MAYTVSKELFLDDFNPIDAVVTWVDGGDPAHRAKMEPFLKSSSIEKHPGTNPVRFASAGEITYCILSILRFAPFVRNIFIVTDNQDPKVADLVARSFPERVKDLKIVDHRVIFDGYQEYLPTFNSISIETMLWRIPGLSNNYIYFNDDTFLVRPTSPTDWFVKNRPVLRGNWNLAPFARIALDNLRRYFVLNLVGKPGYGPRHSFQVTQWLSAKMAGFKVRYFLAGHTPHPMQKQVLRRFFTDNPGFLKKNVSCRFREYSLFNLAALVNHLEINEGNSNFGKTDVAYLQPRKRGTNYIAQKMRFFAKHNNIKFLCVQEIDACSENTRREIFEWLHQIIIG